MNYEDSYNKQEAHCEENNFVFLGWENGMNTMPDIMAKCQHQRFDVQGNTRGSKNIRGCDTCKWYTKYDCSD